MKKRFNLPIWASIGAALLIISGFMPLTRTNLGFWNGGETSYEFGIVFVVAGIIGLILVFVKAKKLFIIPAIIAILGALFMKVLLNLYGSFISFTIWYYLIYVGSILLIIQAFFKKHNLIKK